MKTLPDYAPGSPPPTGYIAWDEWADAQNKAGLKQEQCPVCKLWLFPQEKSAHKCANPTHQKGK